MKKIIVLALSVLTAGISFTQTTYMVNGPLNGQGPLLSTENSGTNTGWTEIHPYDAGLGSSDNSWSAAQTLPFAFEFFGTPVTQFCVSKNHLLTFDASVAGTTLNASVTADNTALPNADLPDNTISYFWGGFGNPAPIGSNDDVWMKEFGVAPNRQLWIKNFSYALEGQDYAYNFVVLEETTNRIYVVDTRWETQNAGTYTVGVQQNATAAVQHASSPNISSINGNITSWNAADIYYYEFIPFIPSGEDAFVSSIDAPSIPTCNLTSNVEVTIGSLGSNTLTQATINWAVNGVAQTPFNWTGSIPMSGSASGIVIGSYTFSDGDLLEVWTSDPNGTTDGDPSNDQTSLTIQEGISGNLTIGATGDYLTFTDAISDITTYDICGPVVFDVETGTYTEQIILPDLSNSSATNTVTFRSQSGDSTDVVLEFAGTGTADNYVVWFNGGDYFNFENMTLSNTGATYARVISVDGNSNNNTISNCVLQGNSSISSTSTNYAVIYSPSASADTNWVFDNNRIIGGSYGAYWYGSSSIPYLESGTVFTNNIFESQYYRGVRLYYQESPTFTGNSATYTSGYGSGLDVFTFSYCDSNLVVANNFVKLDGVYGDGIYMTYCEGSSTTHAEVYNNQIIINTTAITSAVSGMYIGYSDFPKINHNSIFIDNGSSLSEGIYSTGGILNSIKNNSIFNNGPGYGFYFLSNSVGESENNNIYVPNGNVGYLSGAFANLTGWQAATGFDANSISIDPGYSSLNDLHSCSSDLNNAGAPTGVTMDIDGEMRDTSTPDIGVDEIFLPSDVDLGIDTSKCIGTPITIGGGFSAPGGTYLWNDASTTETITVITPGTYEVTATGACGTGTDEIIITDIPEPVADFTQSASYLTVILADASTSTTSWEWDFGDGGTSTLQDPVYVYNAPGTYTITLIATGECGTDTTTQTFSTTVGLDEIAKGEWKMFPNPTENELNVQFAGEGGDNLQIQVLDLSGKVVKQESFIAAEGSNTLQIEVGNLQSGVYLLTLTSSKGISSKKFEVR